MAAIRLDIFHQNASLDEGAEFFVIVDHQNLMHSVVIPFLWGGYLPGVAKGKIPAK